MMYLCIGILVVGAGLMISCSRYKIDTLKERYLLRGIYRILYPPSYFIYRWIFQKYGMKKLAVFRSIYPLKNPETILEERYLKNISHALLLIIGANIAAIILIVAEGGEKNLVDGIYIERNRLGEGSKNVELTADFADVREDIQFVVGEKKLDKSGILALKKDCENYIQKNILGENTSLESITGNLNFFSEISKYCVQIRWETSDYLVIGMDGTVKNKDIAGDIPVKITAICTYFDETWEYSLNVVVVPAMKDESRMREERLCQALSDQEMRTAADDVLTLPDMIHGEPVVWSEKESNASGIILIFGVVAAMLIFARDNESCLKAQKFRMAQLISDYPVFVHKVVLLLGAGMTSKSAWFRIISDYNKNLREGGERRYVYEEMIVAANEMKQGVTEIAAYENFGRRCQTSQYLKFCSILIQSVKTGARGMGRMLSDAGDEAVLLRRENAKRIGEEAGTKLLFPMVVLLGVVMFIVIIPAFMSMNF